MNYLAIRELGISKCTQHPYLPGRKKAKVIDITDWKDFAYSVDWVPDWNIRKNYQ